MKKRIPIVLILLFALTSSGCFGSGKTETSVMATSMSVNSVSWLWKIIPGYWPHRIKMLDIYIQVEGKELRLDELRNDRREERLKYKKLTVVKEEKKDEK